MTKLFQKNWRVLLIGLAVFYLATHLLGLLELPVFADEAIYIRWSQLIMDDWKRYLFFPMNDGKTPLFFWLMVPFQYMFANQLFAARFVSVIIGLLQLVIMMQTVSLLTKNKKTILVSGILVTILPYWFFHHRMALTDGLMTAMVSFSVYFLIKDFVSNTQKKLFAKESLVNVLLAGLFFGLSLYSKVPAVLFSPGLFLLVFLVKKIDKNKFIVAISKVGISIGFGIVLFGLLKFVPSFSQLFGRGSDFLFPLSEVIAGKWQETLPSLPTYFGYFVSYMTPTLFIFMILGLFGKSNKKVVHLFFWAGVLFILPIGIMGRMVYARYLFPAVFWFTLASVFAIEDFFVWAKSLDKQVRLKLASTGFFVLLLANTVGNSSIFMITSMTDHTQIPFISSDTVQYLTEWSSGHGLVETVELIRKESKDKTIAVATEGSFGSLPDGLNLYFHRTDVSNIAIDGVGYPVFGIPKKFAETARNFDEQWLVVNSHRMQWSLPEEKLITEYCRPFDAPCLQVWNITEDFEKYVLD